MYQKREKHVLSSPLAEPSEAASHAIWVLFVAIGRHWNLEDDPGPYRSRLTAFLRNRISLNPLYLQFYEAAARQITNDANEGGVDASCDALLSGLIAPQLGPPETPLEFTRLYVVNELIALRIALGGFQSFGALNYCGFIGGANIEGQPAPYRTFDPSL